MAGRNVAKEALDKPVRATVFCDTVGCEQRAYRRVGEHNICQACEERERQARSDAFCKAQGLNTVEEMRAYCARMAKSWGRGPSFETWTKNISQKTVEIIERMDGLESPTLERLRSAGVIDGRNKLIPLEARKVAADAYRAERARLICEEQRPT